MRKWTIEDVTAGRCELEDLGNEMPEESVAAVAPAGEFDPSRSVADAMELHFRQELHRLGPEAFYSAHPTYVHRVLLKRVAPAQPAPAMVPTSSDRGHPPTLVDQALEHLMLHGSFPPHMMQNRWRPAAANDADPIHPLTRALIGPPRASDDPADDIEEQP